MRLVYLHGSIIFCENGRDPAQPRRHPREDCRERCRAVRHREAGDADEDKLAVCLPNHEGPAAVTGANALRAGRALERANVIGFCLDVDGLHVLAARGVGKNI